VVTGFSSGTSEPALASAYALCERIAREHYENFPVASALLPRAMRPPIAAIYAFARRADDFADEGDLPASERLDLLDRWRHRLYECVSSRRSPPSPASADDSLFFALGDAIRRHRLPVSLLNDLLTAFEQDVTVKRYATWEDLLDYCARSANPVGRLVLRVAGHDDLDLDRASDAVCTALQLTNFWQDLAQDWARGRLYVPLDERDRAGARDADLDAGRITPEWRAALRVMAVRTRALFSAGRPVCNGVSGRLRLELRLTWLGGSRILDRLEQNEFDVFGRRPRLTGADAVPLLWRAVIWPHAA
jgi:hydroxysqualene synthase